MVPNHVELELLAKEIHETRVREADAVRRMATARDTNPDEQRSPAMLWIVNSGSRVRWWFRSRALSPQAPVAPSHTSGRRRARDNDLAGYRLRLGSDATRRVLRGPDGHRAREPAAPRAHCYSAFVAGCMEKLADAARVDTL